MGNNAYGAGKREGYDTGHEEGYWKGNAKGRREGGGIVGIALTLVGIIAAVLFRKK